MGALRHHRVLIAWIALVALLGNLAAGMLCFAPAKAASDLPPEFAAAMVMCAEHGEPAPADDPAPRAKPCQICTAAVLLSLILLAAALIGFVAPARPRWFAFHLLPVRADRLRRAGLGSRAPPLPA